LSTEFHMRTLKNQELNYLITGNALLEDCQIVEDAEITQFNYTHKIKNCKFQSLRLNSSIRSIMLENCSASNLVITGSTIQFIELINCDVKTIKVESYNIVTNKNMVSLKIEGNKTKIEELVIEGIFKKITIKSVGEIRKVTFNSVEVNEVGVYHVKAAIFEFKDVVVTQSAIFTSSIDNILDFHNSKFGEIIVILPTNIEVEISNVKSDSISFHAGTYERIEFIGNGEYDLTIGLQKQATKVNLLCLDGFFLTDKSRIKLLDTDVSELRINDFENNGTLTLNNCSFKNSFSVSNSNLGETILNNIDALSTNILLINSNLLDTIFTNFRWPLNYEFKYLASKQAPLAALRESYRQLKVNYQKSGNRIESLEFQKKELEIHYKHLKQNKFKRPFWPNLGNFLIVGTNKWSSDFGQNIWKPILLLFGIHLLLFNLLLYFTPELNITMGFSDGFGKEATLNGLRLFFQLLLPVHSTDFKVDGSNIVLVGGFLDFLMRIFSGYFLYYFISASRKYHQ
jgi:hypothetical protein